MKKKHPPTPRLPESIQERSPPPQAPSSIPLSIDHNDQVAQRPSPLSPPFAAGHEAAVADHVALQPPGPKLFLGGFNRIGICRKSSFFTKAVATAAKTASSTVNTIDATK